MLATCPMHGFGCQPDPWHVTQRFQLAAMIDFTVASDAQTLSPEDSGPAGGPACVGAEADIWELRGRLEALAGWRQADATLGQMGMEAGMALAWACQAPGTAGRQALGDALEACEGAGLGRLAVEALEWPLGRGRILGFDTLETRPGQRSERAVCAYTAGVLVGLANALSGRRDVRCVERACRALGAGACRFELVAPATSSTGRLSLGQEPQELLLEALFDCTPLGIALFDRHLVLQRCNPAFAGLAARCAGAPAGRAAPGARLMDLLPPLVAGYEADILRALAGETVRLGNWRCEADGRVSYWDVALKPWLQGDEVAGLTVAALGSTERVRARRDLERQLEELTNELAWRRVAAEGLREILAILNSDRPLPEVLDVILAQAVQLLGAVGCAIQRLDAEQGCLRIQAARGLSPEYMAALRIPLGKGVAGQAALERRPVAVPDIRRYLARENPWQLTPEQRAQVATIAGQYPALLAVPLIVNSQVYGALVLYYPEPHQFSKDRIRLAMDFAQQAAQAIANARLRAEAREAAVGAERSRLARELHDSVTQTLFSARLLAEVLPCLWARSPADGHKRTEELRQLTQDALAEMRALLVELHPEALGEAALPELLRQLAEAARGQLCGEVKVAVEGRQRLPLEVQTALYRIAQEALNNAIWHARASEVTLSLRFLRTAGKEGPQGAVDLCISDNGCGFDPQRVPPGHLGLCIMHERAASVGARLRVDSRPGEGTRIAVRWDGEGVGRA